jgi:hypothetical protein
MQFPALLQRIVEAVQTHPAVVLLVLALQFVVIAVLIMEITCCYKIIWAPEVRWSSNQSAGFVLAAPAGTMCVALSEDSSLVLE